MPAVNTVLWFRKSLRLHDSPALHAALKDVDHLYPIFCLDPHFLKPERVGTNRLSFLLEALKDLDSSFRARGTRLLVLKGNPVDLLPELFETWNIKRLCFEFDTEPYAKARDAKIKQLAIDAGVEVISPVGHTLYDPTKLMAKAKGKTPTAYSAFERLTAAVGPPPAPLGDPPQKLPGFDASAPRVEAAEVPALKELGYDDEPSSDFKGGESEALARMADYLSDKAWVVQFEKPKGDPSAWKPRPATTVLSPYLHFGCLSPRLFHAKLAQIEAEHEKFTKPPVSLRGQLLWREFFHLVGFATPNFDKMIGNPICKQIPWDDNEEFYAAWEEARTGYPWIDAIMMQLRTQGWMHHLARHSVACFLTRGDLYVSWERGRDTFDRLLIDGDWSINNANWMWLSCSAFFYQYYRCYSPVSFGRKYDPDGSYVRHFLPVLKDFPSKYIFEPWKAPMADQKKAGCIIGKDYPHPIVDHTVIHKENIQKLKDAYAHQEQIGHDLEQAELHLQGLEPSNDVHHASAAEQPSPGSKRRTSSSSKGKRSAPSRVAAPHAADAGTSEAADDPEVERPDTKKAPASKAGKRRPAAEAGTDADPAKAMYDQDPKPKKPRQKR